LEEILSFYIYSFEECITQVSELVGFRVYLYTSNEYNLVIFEMFLFLLIAQGRFLPLIPSTSLLATRTFYAKAGDVVEMNCTYNFQAPETTYTYSLTWTRNVTKDIQVTSTEVSNTISCHDLG